MPIYQQIIDQVRYHIATGSLQQDEELPSVRVLATKHLINPNTVVRAYMELEREGIIYKRRGMGTYVSDLKIDIDEAEKTRIVRELMDKALVQAVELRLTKEQVDSVFRERLAEFDFDKPGTAGNRQKGRKE